MRRFFLPDAELVAGREIPLTDELRQHIGKVLRLAAGEQVELLDGRGTTARCELTSVTASAGTVQVLAVSKSPPPPLQIELIQGLAKGDKLDLVLQKGTELGAGRFIVCATERSVGHFKAGRSGKLERWQRIVREAARQCGQHHLPQLETAADLATALAASRAELKLLLWEEESRPLPDILPTIAPASISILIGPEGGLTAAEAAVAREAGYRSVRLGPRILRTETAGLAVISILQYLYGDLTSAVMDH